jgi:hypothetical protein
MNVSDAQLFVLFVLAAMNTLFLAVPPVFIYCMIRFEGFRLWVKDLIENGDKVAHTRDARNAVMIFFAYVTGWLAVDVMLGMLLFDKDWLLQFTAVSALFTALLGLTQLQGATHKQT